GPSFRQNLAWPPALTLKATPLVGADPNKGTLGLSLVGSPAGALLANEGTITCGSTRYPAVIQNRPLTNRTMTIPGFDLVDFGGECAASLVLASGATPDPYGGVSSARLSTSFVFGAQPGYGFSDQISPNCQQTFCPAGQQQIEVDYRGA